MLAPPVTLPIGEVIAATTTGFTAQVIEVPRPDAVTPVPEPPPFGAFVRVGGSATPAAEPLPDDFDPFVSAPAPGPSEDPAALPPVLYGVVCFAETGALEAGRPLTAFGLDEDELRREQPQIYELLASRFTAALVAHAEPGDNAPVLPFLPPRPARPHARVFLCGDAETRRLTARLDFLRPLLLGGGSVAGVAFPADELVAALLRRAWRAHGGSEEFALRAGRELAGLLSGDYDRLRALVARMAG